MGLLSNLYARLIQGEKLSPSMRKNWPELEKQWAGRQIEMPDAAKEVSMIGEMGPFSRWKHPDAYAVTSPFGTISLNRELIEKDKQDLGDILVHEMTHAKQGKKGFLRNIYEGGMGPTEMEAIDKETMRKVRKGDIPLRGTTIDPTIKVPTIRMK